MGIFDFGKKKQDSAAKTETSIGLNEGKAEEVTSSTATGALGDEDLRDIQERLKAINRMGKFRG